MSYNPSPQGPNDAHAAAGHPAPEPQGSPNGPYAAMPNQNGPVPAQYGTAPNQASPQLQAAWRFSARRKNDTTAWLLWIGGPFLVGLPVHDFYFGAIGRGLAKIALLVMIFVGFFAGAIGGAVLTAQSSSASSAAMPVGLLVGLLVAGACFLAVVIWWIYDGVTMSRRLEQTNDRIRQEIASEQGVDPYSF